MSPLSQQVEPTRHPDPTQPPEPPPGPPSPLARPWPVDPQDLLLSQRVVLVTGVLDHAAADRAVARLMLLDAEGHDPVELHLRYPDGDLDAAATLADAIESAHVPVRAVAAGVVGGAAVGVLAAADERVASTSCVLTLTEPRAPSGQRQAADLQAAAQRAERLVEQLRGRLAAATGRSVDQVGDDLRRGLVLTGPQALDYGLVTSLR